MIACVVTLALCMVVLLVLCVVLVQKVEKASTAAQMKAVENSDLRNRIREFNNEPSTGNFHRKPNLEKHPNANCAYMLAWVRYHNSIVPIAMTENEWRRARDRGEKNPEDFTGPLAEKPSIDP